jgi:hypothetical protein
MFDVNAAFQQWLAQDAIVKALVRPDRIVADFLPDGADLADHWITFKARGGARHSEISTWVEESFEVTCWAETGAIAAARKIALAISDLVFNTLNITVNEAQIVSAVEEVAPQNIADTTADWTAAVYYCRVSMRPKP